MRMEEGGKIRPSGPRPVPKCMAINTPLPIWMEVRLRHLRRSLLPDREETTMAYVDGFIVAIPQDRLADYKKLARKAGKIWLEHGALEYVECIGDDVPVGKLTSFPKAVKLQDGEIVVFSWIIYKSRAERDAVMKKVMADPRLSKEMSTMPFDGKRMIFGGFKTILEM